MTILILGGADDEHAAHIHRELSTRGHDAEFLDSRDFPQNMRIAYDPQRGGGSIRLPRGRAISLAGVRSVYWRNYHGIGQIDLPHPEQAYIAANDARSLIESLLINLPCRWVNGWAGFQLHQTKPAALARVAKLGVKIPATTLTNDPKAVRAFADEHPRCIFKPVQGGAHTQRLTADHLSDENLANLALAPVTVQEEIEGTNIRVFVAGEATHVCEVATGDVDFRDDPHAEITACDLPEEIAEQSRRIAQALDLLWTGIDFRRTPDGEYYFLEANPSPMFLGFEQQTGLPLTDALVRLLTE